MMHSIPATRIRKGERKVALKKGCAFLHREESRVVTMLGEDLVDELRCATSHNFRPDCPRDADQGYVNN